MQGRYRSNHFIGTPRCFHSHFVFLKMQPNLVTILLDKLNYPDQLVYLIYSFRSSQNVKFSKVSPFWKKGCDSVSSNWHPLLYTKKTLHLDDCLFLQLKCSSLEVKVWYKSFSTLSFFQPKAKCNIKLKQCSKTILDSPHKFRRECTKKVIFCHI